MMPGFLFISGALSGSVPLSGRSTLFGNSVLAAVFLDIAPKVI